MKLCSPFFFSLSGLCQFISRTFASRLPRASHQQGARQKANVLKRGLLFKSPSLFLAASIALLPGQLAAIGMTKLQSGPGPSIVSINGRQLVVCKRSPDGSLAPCAPYVIRGVVWSPASTTTNTSKTDPNNANVRRAEFGSWAAIDIPLIKAMNANTVRMLIDPGLDSNGRAVLDQLYNQGIMVIMTVDDAINDTSRLQQV